MILTTVDLSDSANITQYEYSLIVLLNKHEHMHSCSYISSRLPDSIRAVLNLTTNTDTYTGVVLTGSTHTT